MLSILAACCGQASTPAELLRFMEEEATVWGGIAKKTGLHID
jgi:hypothetical protein